MWRVLGNGSGVAECGLGTLIVIRARCNTRTRLAQLKVNLRIYCILLITLGVNTVKLQEQVSSQNLQWRSIIALLRDQIEPSKNDVSEQNNGFHR